MLLRAAILLFTSVTSLTISALADAQKPPNIILIMTDDQGYGDLSIHGNPIVKTPHIDKLATQSARLDNYHVSPTCAPTRGALMTGRWSNRTGVWHTVMGRSLLRTNEVTLADYLSDAGYQTAMVGKWHLGDNYPYRPHDRGFQHAFYHGAGGVGQTPDYWDNSYFDDTYFRNGVAEKSTGFVTDVLFAEGIQYIETFRQQQSPFFLYLSTNAPHGPMHAPKAYADMYKNEKIPTKIKHFFGMITNIDDNVAKLRSYLEQHQLAENTLVIFTTDNGTSAGNKVFNAGMRGKKNSEYDGGHRVPMFIHWPAGGLDKEQRINTLTGHVDMVPTLLELVGGELPRGNQFDGLSLKPLLYNSGEEWPDRVMVTDSQRIYWPEKWRKSAVMTQQWRLINGRDLYDIHADPSQQNDISKQYPKVVAKLRGEYHDWWQTLAPSFTQTAPLYVGDDKANPVTLTSHDWLGYNATVPWNQRHIRSGLREKDGVHKSFWMVDIRQSGKYRCSLRRWPASLDLAITSGLAAGATVAGDKAFRATKGTSFNAITAHLSVQDQVLAEPVSRGASHVDFIVDLTVGLTELKAYFQNSDKQQLGSYYVSVERIESTANNNSNNHNHKD